MPRSLELYLSDLLKAGIRIRTFIKDMKLSDYESNELVRSAVERQFTIIGEAMRQMEQHYPGFFHGILESRRIVDFRNFLVHQYANVDDEEVWSAARSKLPDFMLQIQALLDERTPPPSF